MNNLTDKPKIILWDIETSRYITKTFEMWGVNIHQNFVVKDADVLCICWKELGEKTVHCVHMFEDDDWESDRNVIEAFHKIVQDADILIAHNGDQFDLKRFNAKVIEYGLPPLHPVLTIDTKKEVKKIARFSHNNLDFLGRVLIGDRKLKTGTGLWDDVEAKSLPAMKKMVKYCKQDVNLLEKVYTRLRPYMKSHPNIAQPFEHACPKCASKDVHKHKIRLTRSGVRKQQFQCQSCGSYFTERLNNQFKPESKI